jgi:hypothetical protein
MKFEEKVREYLFEHYDHVGVWGSYKTNVLQPLDTWTPPIINNLTFL